MNKRKITTYEETRLRNGRQRVTDARAPKRLHATLKCDALPDCSGVGWDMCAGSVDYFRNIICAGNRDLATVNNSDYAELYDNIMQYAVSMYYLEDALTYNVGPGKWYASAADVIKEYLGVTVNGLQAVKVKKALKTIHNDNALLCELLTILTPHKWETGTMRGYSQGDWQDIIYPADVYSDADIQYYTAFYMGMYREYVYTYKGETVTDFIPDNDAWRAGYIESVGRDIFGIGLEESINFVLNECN